MAIEPIGPTESGTNTRAKMNAAIDKVNRVDGVVEKVDTTVDGLILAVGYDNRPADARILFTASLTGSGKDQAPIDFGQAVTNAEGTALRVTSTGGDPIVVASRVDQATEVGLVYSARIAVRRATNTSDPLGDAVQFGLSCLNAAKQKVAERIFFEGPIAVADGLVSRQVTFSRDQAADQTLSETTRYVRPFVRIFGGNGVTDIEVVGSSSTQGLPGPKGDTGDLTPAAQAAANEIKTNTGIVEAQTGQTLAATAIALAARDAATSAADAFTSLAAGLAATANGKQFQVITGDVSARYTNNNGTAVEVPGARFVTARVALLNKYYALDRGVGLVWSPATYFLDALRPQDAWYDISDLTTLFQDEARTIPVTAAEQPVRAILDKSGNGHHKSLISGVTAGVLKLVNGKYLIRGGAYKTSADKVLSTPMYIAMGATRRGRVTANLFGVHKASNELFCFYNQATSQGRTAVRTRNGTPAIALKETNTQFRHAPLDAPQVEDSLFKPGYQDIAINGKGRIVDTNAWAGTESTTGCAYSINLANVVGTSPSAADMDFYGGLIIHSDPGEDLRAKIVAYLAVKVQRAPAATDINGLWIGDSTGDQQNEDTNGGEVVWRFANYLAAQNPGKYVGIRLAEWTYNPTLGYHPEIVVQNETNGAGAIRIYNCSIAGSQPAIVTGALFDLLIGNLPPLNWIGWNHGFNIDAASANSRTTIAAQFLQAMDQVRRRWPAVPNFALSQPRTQNASGMNDVRAALLMVSALYRDLPIADVYQRYEDLNRDPSLYADGLHPSMPLGVDQYIAALIAMWEANQPLGIANEAQVNNQVVNGLANGQFKDWTAALPSGWTKVGAGIISKEIVLVDAPSRRSLKIADTAAQQTYLQQTISAVPYRGGSVFVAVRRYIIPGDDTATTQMTLGADGTGGTTSVVTEGYKPKLGWQWAMINVAVPADAATITLRLYGRLAGAAMTVLYDRAVLAGGNAPRDML